MLNNETEIFFCMVEGVVKKALSIVYPSQNVNPSNEKIEAKKITNMNKPTPIQPDLRC